MMLLLLIAALLAIAIWTRRPALEFTIGTLLACPILEYVSGRLFGFSQGASVLVLLTCLGAAYLVSAPARGLLSRRQEGWNALVLLVSYLVFYRLCLLWPDFISIGERLRDYAILSATIRDPIAPPEPWMTDTILNYYVYWYRFGQFLAAIGANKAWGAYHELAAFALAGYVSCCFRLLFVYLRFSLRFALGGSFIIGCGSNLAGIINFLTRDNNWWGPSRVIHGGIINEFPAWSFLLGDVHPHYLNLMLLPFMTCIVLLLFESGISVVTVTLAALIWGPLTGAWLYAANAWEIPAWGLLSFWLLATGICLVAREVQTKNWDVLRNFFRQFQLRVPFVVGALLVLLITISLYWSTRHLQQPQQFALKPVGGEVTRTLFSELISHWGVQFIALCLATIFAEVNFVMALAALALFVGGIFANEAVLPIAFLGLVLLLQRFSVLFQSERAQREHSEAGQESASTGLGTAFLVTALPLAFVSIIIFPEFYFIDDAYGGEIERMNTIFKFYSAAWWMSWMAVFLLGREAYGRLSPKLKSTLWQILPRPAAAGLTLLLLLGFFYRTIPLRRTERFSVEPVAQGLSTIDQRFPGSAGAIKHLTEETGAVILEAQGNAYDYTTHIATLSGQQSFLGWGNHVGLLTGKYDEVHRREQFTENWYHEQDCAKRNTMLLQEGITHVVVGPLEKQRYSPATEEHLSCLDLVLKSGEYTVYKPKVS